MRPGKSLIDDFQYLDTWEDRYQYIIDLGRRLPFMEAALKTETSRVSGCMSKVWLLLFEREGKVYFRADSDALIVRGLIAIVAQLFNGRSKQEILDTDVGKIFHKLGLDKNLASTRRNGIASVIEKIRHRARQ